MFLGHFAVALSAKQFAPKVSLGTLVLSAQLADLLWPAFLLAGWEHVQIVPGLTPITPLDFISYPYSHSLLAQALWAGLLGAVYYAVRKNGRGALVVGLCVPSHWLLDFISHRPDLPLVPGGERYGIGLWNHPVATVIVELAFLAGGVAIYYRTVRPKQGARQHALWALLILLVLLYFGAIFGPPPPNVRTLALTGLILWLMVPWAAWADRESQVRRSG
jgi:hypothetical protein